MKKTAQANRLHIGIFGRRNVGKSSFINAFTSQDLAIVSEVPGTTADPVYKSIEILPKPGPCVIIDTAGLDDVGQLGELRKKKALQVLNKTDLAILLLAPETGWGDFEEQLLTELRQREIPIVIVVNKIDQDRTTSESVADRAGETGLPVVKVSAATGEGVLEFRGRVNDFAPENIEDLAITAGVVKAGDLVVMVIPIDDAMPRGRLILPEVQTLRDLLDRNVSVIVTKEVDLDHSLAALGREPDLVITDSQVYEYVKDHLPTHIPLTSFSMLFARYKGDLRELVAGVHRLEQLGPDARILIGEACTHHPQKDDIGRVKIPRMLRSKLGDGITIEQSAGGHFPDDLSSFDLVIHCGACMINQKQMHYRINLAREAGVPITNYGILFAWVNGILERALEKLV
jgi:[FeFe] hydrogenase H-cluster maturation GTPase HydF